MPPAWSIHNLWGITGPGDMLAEVQRENRTCSSVTRSGVSHSTAVAMGRLPGGWLYEAIRLLSSSYQYHLAIAVTLPIRFEQSGSWFQGDRSFAVAVEWTVSIQPERSPPSHAIVLRRRGRRLGCLLVARRTGSVRIISHTKKIGRPGGCIDRAIASKSVGRFS